jgi:hypothetical protein
MLHSKFFAILTSCMVFLTVQAHDYPGVDPAIDHNYCDPDFDETQAGPGDDEFDLKDPKIALELEKEEWIKVKQHRPFEVFTWKEATGEPRSAELLARQQQISKVLQNYYAKPINADRLRPWSIMHGVLAYGQDSLVSSMGNSISAVDYLCANGIGHDRKLMTFDSKGLAVSVGIGFQGHEGQLLAILAQVKTPLDHTLQVQDQTLTMRELVEFEKLSCRPNTELTFKLIGLLNYLDSDEEWTDSSGGKWNLSRLIFEELKQPINGAACGGIHRLMGLSYAVETRKARNEPLDGQWKRAESFVQSYIEKVFRLQNSDGGFSTEFFEGKSNSQDRIRQIYSTGHALEWLAIALSDEQLERAEVGRMIDFLVDQLEKDFRPQSELNGNDVGPKGHALRALRLYELRVFGEPTPLDRLPQEKSYNLVDAYEYTQTQSRISTVSAPSSSERGNIVTPASTSSSRNNRFMRRR